MSLPYTNMTKAGMIDNATTQEEHIINFME